MTRNCEIARAVRRALMFGAVTAVGASLPVHSQDQPAEPPTLTTVTVTGSRIVAPNLTSVSPVTAISGEDLVNSGRTRVEDVLNQLPQVFGSQNSGVSNGSNGTSLLNLRDLDSKRTLVLINGRRLGPGDPSGGFARNSYGADVNMLPSELVQRVDVLTGGASSVYGADAVAGVVNFVMNDHFEGVRISATYGFYDHDNNNAIDSTLANSHPVVTVPSNVHAGFNKEVNFILGFNTPDNKGNATFYATYRNIAPILQGPYDYSACTLFSGDQFACGGSSTTGPPYSNGRFRLVNPDGSLGPSRTIAADGTLVPYSSAANAYNYGALNYFQRPDERYTAGAFTHYEFNEHVDAYSELMYMRDDTTSQIAPSGAFYGGNPTDLNGALTVNCSNPFLTASELTSWCGGSTAGSASLLIGRRNVEGGPRQQSINHTDYRVVIGAKGDINDAWKYDVSGQYGTVQLSNSYLNDLSWSNIQNALQVGIDPNTGQPACLAAISGADSRCVPWNIFQPGKVTQAATNYLSIPLLQIGSVTERVANANFTGDLGKYGVQLPTAKSGLAINLGGEYRQEKSDFEPDLAYINGLGAGQGGATLPIKGAYSVREGFLEARLPIMEDMPFAKSLDFETGYRYSDYSLDFQTNTYKFGLTWSPLDDVRFRGTFQRAVRVPNIGELYNPVSVGLDGVTDPCSGTSPVFTLAQCARTGVTATQYGNIDSNPAAQYNGNTGGNPNLKPETAITKSFGVTLTPTFLEGLRLSVDYFDIRITNAIQNPNADFTLALCALTGNPVDCNRIHRDQNGSLFGSPSNSYVDDLLENIGEISTKGIDIDTAYRLNAGFLGKFNFSLVGTYTDSLKTTPQPGASYECAGYFGSICQAPLPKWRHVFTTNWVTPIKNLDFSVVWRFYDAVRLDAFAPGLGFLAGADATAAGSTSIPPATDVRLSSRSYFDLSTSYRYNNYKLRLGVNNVLDKDPPINGSTVCPTGPCNGNTWPVVYDVAGRYMFATLTAEF